MVSWRQHALQHLFVSLLLLICIVLQSPFKSPSILSELSEVKTSRTENFLRFSGWALGSQLPPRQASRERGLQTPFPTRRCQARAVDSGDPTVGNCSHFCQEPSKARERGSVSSQRLCADTGLGQRGDRRGGLSEHHCARDGGCATLVCPPWPVRLGPMLNNMLRSSAKGRRCPRGGSPISGAELLEAAYAQGGCFPLDNGGGVHTAVHSSCKILFGTWARNSLSANLRVYFCGQV